MSTSPSSKSSFSSLLKTARPSSRNSVTDSSSPPLGSSGTFRRPGLPRQLYERAKESISPKLHRGARPGSSSSSLSASLTSTASLTPTDLETRATKLYEARALALFPALPFELQAHILGFLETRTLVRNVARVDHYYGAMVDGLIKAAVRRAMGKSWGRQGSSYRLVFEAQRPIDTLTTKHALYFSHFEDSGIQGTVKAQFDFLPLASTKAQAESKSREREASVQHGGMEGRANVSAAGWRYPRVPEVHRESLGMRELSASIPSPTRAGAEVTDSQDGAEACSTSRVTAPILVPQARREALHNRYNRTELVSDNVEAEAEASSSSMGTDALAASPLSVGPSAGASSYSTAVTTDASSSVPAQSFNVPLRSEEPEDIDAPMDAYDWAGPISSSADVPGRHSRSLEPGKAAQGEEMLGKQQRRPTYRFELDPLDNFESWCLSLTLQRRDRQQEEQEGGVVNPGEERRRGLRWEKRVAEGLDRTFRTWWSVDPSSRSSNSIEASAAAPVALPTEQTLELDASCTLSIQPHPSSSLSASSAHPAHSTSSHTYLSLPLTSQYLTTTSRVKLTFHTVSLSINAARLAAQLEDVAEDVERAKQLALGRTPGAGVGRVVAGFSGGSSWSAGMGGSRRLTEGGVWIGHGVGVQGAAAVIHFGGSSGN